MRRFRFPLLILATLIVALLFLSDFLTGRVHYEFENPYSRTRRIVERKFGFQRVSIVPHPEMSALYYDQLKQPRVERWELSLNCYRVEKFTGRQIIDKAPVAPVMFLKPEQEVAFLRALPDDAIRRAVILSLFQPRKIGDSPEINAHNARLARQETERVRTIFVWYDVDRKDYGLSPRQWWLKNAAKFGIRPNGAPLAPAANSLAKSVRRQNQIARNQP